jgi:hypothetical protein
MRNNKSYKYLAFILIIITLLIPDLLFSQFSSRDSAIVANRKLRNANSEGTEFWLCFQRNYKDNKTITPQTELHLEFFITSDEDAVARIVIDGIGFDQTVKVPAGAVKNIKIPSEAQIKSDEVKERLAVHITSDKPVAVYGLNRRFQTTDTYLGLPTSVLGSEYRTMCYTISEGLMSQFAIVATENGTDIEITPSANTGTHKVNVPFTITLNKGDVYQVAAFNDRKSPCDLTGSYIRATKKIAVFSGHQCAYVPPTIMACNNLVEQIPPIPSWGKHFYLGLLKPRSNYTFRVLANEKNTRVFLDAKLIRTLGPGQFWDSTLKRNSQITANKPILVAQFSQGFKNGDSIGDPMMLLISPTQQFLRQYRFATPINGSWKHNINVIVPNQGIPTMRLNGQPLDQKQFTALGISRYSIATINVPYGSHVIEGDLPFGMYSYGFGFGNDSYDAYGNMAGQSFVDYEPAADTLPPMVESKLIDGKFYMIARDDRVDDTGLKDINEMDNLGIDIKIPKIEEGAPQIQLQLKPVNSDNSGRAVIKVRDMALNEKILTICYYFDGKSEKYLFSVREGIIDDCMPDPGFQIGAYAKIASNLHSSDFSNSGNMTANGKFSSASAFGGYFGLLIGRRITSDLTLTGRLSFENYAGTLIAPDSVTSKIRKSDGTFLDFQEAKVLDLNGISMSLSFVAEYYIKTYLYAFGGFDITIQLSKSVALKSRILIPNFTTYPNGQREITDPQGITTLNSINSIRLGLLGGFGVNVPINYQISVFSELFYHLPISNMINDGDWKVNQLGIQIGARYRI